MLTSAGAEESATSSRELVDDHFFLTWRIQKATSTGKPEGMQVRSGMPKQKKFLLVGDKVEQVRQLEEGLRGSWQTGNVIGVSENTRVIRYDHFVDEDGITNCVERVAVSGTIGGAPSSSARVPSAYTACGHRSRIRPSVPPFVGPRPNDFWYGLCVDALYEDGWWEGVVFDNKVGSGERSVFFPDEGDEVRFNVDRLRLTHDWDEVSGTWTARGTWAFLALVNELTDGTAAWTPLWVKQLWYNLRSTDGFLRRISEWTLGDPSLWRTLMNKAIFNHLHKIMGKPNLTPVNGLSWTILRYVNDSYKNNNPVSATMIEFQNKISIALDVLHECFLPVIEDRTGSDLVSDVLFNRR
ncbi:hypothetical protein EJ110_NYTH56861 [Nymphaea thermarum]|nr:hypothetical protein EJ110_NYTH56861 [Nymphaea thermarum]